MKQKRHQGAVARRAGLAPAWSSQDRRPPPWLAATPTGVEWRTCRQMNASHAADTLVRQAGPLRTLAPSLQLRIGDSGRSAVFRSKLSR
jgi:hypothetical protein